MIAKHTILWTIGVFSLNLLFKGVFLSSNSIGWDEPFSIYYAQLDVSQICKTLANGNNPPLYEIFLHYWIKLFGIGEFSVRLPSLIFSSAAAAVVFLIGQKFFNFRVGLTASLIFTFSNYQVFFAHEARVYALFGMLTALSIYFFLNLSIKERIKFRELLPLYLVNVILIYSHYFGFVILLMQTGFIFAFPHLRQKLWKAYLIYSALMLLAYLPNIRILVSRFVQSSSEGTWVKVPNDFESLYEMFRQFSNAPVVAVVVIALLLCSFILYVVRSKRSTSDFPTKLIIISFFIPYLMFFIISYWIPMFVDRYLIFSTIPLVILLAICADSVFSESKFRIFIHAFVVLLFIITCKPNLDNRRHVKETITKINELKTESTLVIFCPDYFIFNYAYYEDRNIFQDVDSSDPYERLLSGMKNRNIIGMNTSSDLLNVNTNHIIYLDAGADFSFPDNGIIDYLENNYVWEVGFEFPEIFKVHSFRKPN